MRSEPIQLINSDPKILVFSREELSAPHASLNVDVEVRFADSRWGATFFTVANLESLMNNYARTGECASGTYVWAADMVVVREISAEVIRTTVADLIAAEEFEQAFGPLADAG